MTASITSVNGQSLYDLCNMSYGTPDNMVKFATDNSILDINYIPVMPQVFNYDTSLIADGKTNSFVFATAVPQNFILSETGEVIDSETGEPLITE